IGALDEVLVVRLLPHAVIEGDHFDVADLVLAKAGRGGLLRLGGADEGDGLGQPERRVGGARAKDEIASRNFEHWDFLAVSGAWTRNAGGDRQLPLPSDASLSDRRGAGNHASCIATI